eukprot:GHVP01021049.1.p1 GENE.GHVP01021049.1~~GHVP01021049.1.p1  ORF type:complete len:171 (-),score=23.95 GHVP01021049.1:49-561(-)
MFQNELFRAGLDAANPEIIVPNVGVAREDNEIAESFSTTELAFANEEEEKFYFFYTRNPGYHESGSSFDYTEENREFRLQLNKYLQDHGLSADGFNPKKEEQVWIMFYLEKGTVRFYSEHWDIQLPNTPELKPVLKALSVCIDLQYNKPNCITPSPSLSAFDECKERWQF